MRTSRGTIIAIALFLATSLFIRGTASRPASAASAVPHAFVEDVFCDTNSQAVAGFVVPGVPDTRARLAELGVEGLPDAVWIDLSLLDNAFEPGTFLNAGPFPTELEGRRFNWFGLLAQTPHYYRLNALVGNRWVSLGGGHFETPDCRLLDLMYCDRNTNDVVAEFVTGITANPPNGTPLAVWIDLSLFDNAFAPRTFLGAGPFPPMQRTTFAWRGLLPDTQHFYRLNALFTLGWAAQFTSSIVTLDCHALPAMPPPGSI